ncbi:MAG: hypothetical protein WCJ71_05800 [Candidatus Omnitrophota bacterium]
MKDRFNNAGAEYLDDLGRYRQTEQALENATTIHFVEEKEDAFVVTTRFGFVYGPFSSHVEARKWATTNDATEISFLNGIEGEKK